MTTRQASLSQPQDEQQPAGTTVMLVQYGYWNGFMRRHRHIIRSKRNVECKAKLAEWCTYKISPACTTTFMKQWPSMALHQNATRR